MPGVGGTHYDWLNERRRTPDAALAFNYPKTQRVRIDKRADC